MLIPWRVLFGKMMHAIFKSCLDFFPIDLTFILLIVSYHLRLLVTPHCLQGFSTIPGATNLFAKNTPLKGLICHIIYHWCEWKRATPLKTNMTGWKIPNLSIGNTSSNRSIFDCHVSFRGG